MLRLRGNGIGRQIDKLQENMKRTEGRKNGGEKGEKSVDKEDEKGYYR